MKIKLFEFNRYIESLDQFEERVRKFVQTNSNVVEMKSWENLSNSGVTLQLTLGEERLPDQDFSLFAGLDLETLEELANNTLASVSRTDQHAKSFNVVSLNKPYRYMFALLVQKNESDLHGFESEVSTETGEKEKVEQGTGADASPNSSAERGKRNRNRKAS